MVRFLERAHSVRLAAGAKAEDQHRRAAGIGLEDTGNEIGDAGSGTAEAGCEISRGAGIGHSHERAGRLVANSDCLGRVRIVGKLERIVEMTWVAGETEDVPDPLSGQPGHHQVPRIPGANFHSHRPRSSIHACTALD